MSENKLNLENMYENEKEWSRWDKMEDSDLAKIDPEKLTESEKYYFSYQLENRLAYKYQYGWSQYSTSPSPEQGKEDGVPKDAMLCYEQNQCEDIDPNEQYVIIDEDYIHRLTFLDIVNRTSREYLTQDGRIDWEKWNHFSNYGAVSIDSYETELGNFTLEERNEFDVENSPASKDFFKKLPYAGHEENTIIVFNKDLISYKRPIDNIKEALETFKTYLEEKKIQREWEDNWEEKYMPSKERPSRRGVDAVTINQDDDRR